MRRYILILLCAIAVSTTYAQSPRGGETVVGKASFAKFQSHQIEQVLKLKGERLEQFKVLYAEYATAVKPRLKDGRGRGGYERQKSLSESQIESEILASFERAKRAIEIKEEYYHKFREILSVREISTMYEIERRALERITDEVERRADAPKH